jgi:hypothetical protein
VPDAAHALPRLFLTFAGNDLAQVRPLAASLRVAGVAGLDYAVPSEPFSAQRAGLIRASLALRLKRCAATVCLYSPRTLDDEWVRWTLAVARELRLPLVGAALDLTASGGVADLLRDIGAEIVPLRTEAIRDVLPPVPAARQRELLTVESLSHTLRMMKQPLR